MKRLTYLLLVCCVIVITSCKKETQTDAQLISKQLQNLIKTENVVRVIPITQPATGGTISFSSAYGKTYQFNPPFISVESTSYNLLSLKSYYISYLDSDKTLFLLFY